MAFQRTQMIPLAAKCINESLLMDVNRKATIMNKNRTGHTRFIGNKMRRHAMEYLVPRTKIKGNC